MHTKLLLLFASASVVLSHDISIGSDTEGRRIFDEIRQANPAIWRQIENVTIIAPNDEVISRVVVTDMRPEKDGDAEIVNGGEGEKTVTIELKSPTVLRGYEFHLEVYSVPETKLTDAEEHLPEPTPENTEDKTENTEDKTENTEDKTENTEDKTENTEDKTENTEETHEMDGSGDNIEGTNMPTEAEKTTEMSESSTDKDIPVLVGRVVDGDILRPARETNDEDISPPSVLGSESDAMTTENTNTEMNVSDATTEADMTTKLDENEEMTPAAETFDNSKNIPDYPSLSILDYIKSKEAVRPIRRTDDETSESNNDATTEKIAQSTESVDISYTTLPADESSVPNKDSDDTVDLIPPIETEYNTGFSSSDENEKPVATSTFIYNRPRAGRGLDVDDLQEPIPTSTIASDITTADYESENSTTESTLDEQERNTRDARKEAIDESNEFDAALDSNQNNQIPLCAAGNGDKPSNGINPNVIVLNGESLTITPDANKLQYGIPIVLIIGSDTNIPTIKIIAEDANSEAKDIQPLESSDETGPEHISVEKMNDYPQDRDEEQGVFVPRPVMDFS